MDRAPSTERHTVAGSSAVIWIDAVHAVVAQSTDGPETTLSDVVAQGDGEEADPTYLARVVDTVGDRERIVIMGPDASRLALEREYVAIHHRPDRLIDVEPAGPLDRDGLVARLEQLRS